MLKIYCACFYKKFQKLNVSFLKLGRQECKRSSLHARHLEDVHKLDKIVINVINNENGTSDNEY